MALLNENFLNLKQSYLFGMVALDTPQQSDKPLIVWESVT